MLIVRRPGNRQRVPAQVTQEAADLALELRPVHRLLFEGVEDGALPRIVRGDLQHVGPSNPSDRGDVVEEQRPWILGADKRGLIAGLGKDKDLGLDWKVERRQQRRQVPVRRAEREPHGAGLELTVQA